MTPADEVEAHVQRAVTVSMPWETLPDGKEKHLAYLASRDRALLEEEVRSRSAGLCERCLGRPASQVRLMSYAALYREKPEDLLHVCVPCDEFLCGQRRRDPFLDVPVRADGMIVETVDLAGKITGTTWRDEIVDTSSVCNEGGWSAENHSGIDTAALDGDWVTSGPHHDAHAHLARLASRDRRRRPLGRRPRLGPRRPRPPRPDPTPNPSEESPVITMARPSGPAPIRRADAAGRARRPGRPGGTGLIHRTGPGPGGRTFPSSEVGSEAGGDNISHAGDAARSDWSNAGD